MCQHPPSHSPTHLPEGSLGVGWARDTVGGRSPEKTGSDLAIWRDGHMSYIYRSTRFPTACASNIHTGWCIVAEFMEFDEFGAKKC